MNEIVVSWDVEEESPFNVDNLCPDDFENFETFAHKDGIDAGMDEVHAGEIHALMEKDTSLKKFDSETIADIIGSTEDDNIVRLVLSDITENREKMLEKQSFLKEQQEKRQQEQAEVFKRERLKAQQQPTQYICGNKERTSRRQGLRKTSRRQKTELFPPKKRKLSTESKRKLSRDSLSPEKKRRRVRAGMLSWESFITLPMYVDFQKSDLSCEKVKARKKQLREECKLLVLGNGEANVGQTKEKYVCPYALCRKHTEPFTSFTGLTCHLTINFEKQHNCVDFNDMSKFNDLSKGIDENTFKCVHPKCRMGFRSGFRTMTALAHHMRTQHETSVEHVEMYSFEKRRRYNILCRMFHFYNVLSWSTTTRLGKIFVNFQTKEETVNLCI